MQLTVELAGETHQLDFRREETTVTAEIDGRAYQVSARRLDENVYLLIAGGRIYECRIDSIRTKTRSVVVQLGNDSYRITLIDPRRLRDGGEPGAHVIGGTAQICSPMAGKVVRVLVEQGAVVKAGDGIVVVEAMKMQNELKSQYDGVVTEVRAKAGSTVNAGEILAIIA